MRNNIPIPNRILLTLITNERVSRLFYALTRLFFYLHLDFFNYYNENIQDPTDYFFYFSIYGLFYPRLFFGQRSFLLVLLPQPTRSRAYVRTQRFAISRHRQMYFLNPS